MRIVAEQRPAGDRGGDDTSVDRPPDVLHVLVVAATIVLVVALAVVLTGLLPDELSSVVYETPLAIGVLIVGTGLVLWRIARRQRA
jgi:protein-S-isoprenylcysteine O-methyltransferase Ste14